MIPALPEQKTTMIPDVYMHHQRDNSYKDGIVNLMVEIIWSYEHFILQWDFLYWKHGIVLLNQYQDCCVIILES